MNGESRPKAAPDITCLDSTTSVTSSGPTWYLEARPLTICCHEDEYAIDCPQGCGREALAWRSRPGYRVGGWSCVCGARGFLWQLLGRSSANGLRVAS